MKIRVEGTPKKSRETYMKAYREANREKIKAYSKVYSKVYYKVNCEKTKARSKAYRKANNEKVKGYRERMRDLELLIIAQRWEDDVPRCRADLTSGLKETAACSTKLQIDHMNGGGRQEGYRRQQGVVNGTRELDDLRILCELHQQAYAILRGDTNGGSDSRDWAL